MARPIYAMFPKKRPLSRSLALNLYLLDIHQTKAKLKEGDEHEEDNQEGQGQEDEGGANKDLIGDNEEEKEGEVGEVEIALGLTP